ncbi:MAG TPA: NACHT domain-containing protein [Rickettsia endosymbiont of Omalisus fontisbellaquei]|nr:NACHT domain-containing protein [Rickettsia endosymbiont of Omalisus fontisbellaquei]
MQTSILNSLITRLKTLYSSHDTLPKLIDDEKIKAQSLEEYYVKLQILLSEGDEAGKAASHDKVVGEKKSVEIENIFKAIDTKEKIRELLKKELPNKDDEIDNIIRSFKAEKNKIDVLYKNLPNKRESEIKNIAESINRIQVDIGKVLLLGSAGIGKTTLMHYLSYKWGKEELWNDKFDYVFRVKLKELLNESWKDGYSGYFDINNLSQSKLNCFIHYCLGGSESTLSVKEIMDIKNKDKVLLLLDGYDEVAHLNTRDEFKKLIDNILEYKNVIMTSRPNAVVEEMSNRFERKVENTGWDSEGIEQYVNKNFEVDKELGTQLTSFLNTHSQIKEICKVPISTALICLVWSDKDIRDKFQKNSDEDFNISRLYSEIINWLNNRHLEKTQNKYKNKTEANNHLKNILRFLEQIAYESLVATGKLVERKLVEDTKDTLDIDEVIEQGLLRREGQNFQFIHLTFQEFLAACYLENQLLDNHTKSEKAAFIGEHRNEPKYLMTLKFLAGIVNNDDDQELIEIFWEAAICNVDGILELGIERKIILLMHLLTQSKINGKFDNKIPHLKQIQNLIDDIVLKDITIWEQHIIDSGYLSEEIIKTVNEKLGKGKATPQELKASVGIIAALANRNEWGSKTQIYEKLVNSLKIENTRSQKLVLQKLAQILEGTDKTVIRESLDKILSLLNIWELNEYVNIILIKVINIIPDLDKKVLNHVKMLDDKLVIIESLVEIVKAIPSLAPQAIKKLQELLEEPDEDTQDDLIKSVKFDIAGGLVEIVKAKSSLASEQFKELKKLFADPNYYIKDLAANSLPEVIKAMPIEEALTILKDLLSSSDISIQYQADRSLREVVKIMSAEEAFTVLKNLFNDPNDYVKHAAIENLDVVLEIKPSLVKEVFSTLKKILNDLNINNFVNKYAAIKNLNVILEIKPSLAGQVFTMLKKLFSDPETGNYFNYEIAKILGEIVKAKPSLAEEVFTILKKALNNPNNHFNDKITQEFTEEEYTMLQDFFNRRSDYIQKAIINSLNEIIKVKLSLTEEIFIILKELLNISSDYVKKAIISSLSEIIRVKSNLAEKIFTILKKLLNSSDPENYFKSDTFEVLIEVIKIKPSLIGEALAILKEILSKPNNENFFKSEALDSLVGLLKIKPSLVEEVFTMLKEIFSEPSNKNFFKPEILTGLIEIVKAKPSLAEEVFTMLKEILITANDEYYIEYTLADSLVEIVKAKSSLAEEVFEVLKEVLSKPDYTDDAKYKAAISLIEVVESIPLSVESYKQVNELLKIIILNETQEFDKSLHIEAKTTLNKITHHITQEYEKSKNPEVIEWFTASFNELPNISETRIFLKEICKSILKSGVINEYESKFILSCIKKYNFTFTVSVNKEQGIEGQIIFEDRNYEIFTTNNSASKIVTLEEFATKLLAETNDPLAEQYKTHKPLFPNKGLALKIAASDINYVSSIANENEKLSTEKYLLSYAGDNKDKFVMLLEKRSIFGDHLIYKLDKDNHNFEKIAATYPDEIDKDIEEQLFEELDFEKLFEYIVRNNSLNSEEEKQIFKHPDKLKFVSEIMKKDGARTINFKLPKHDTHKRLDIHEKILGNHNKTLKDSGTIQKAEIFRKIESLTQENPLLYDYCNSFYYYIKNTINAIQIAETKIFKNNINEKEAIIKMLAKGIGLIMKNLLIDILTDLACSILEARRERKRGNEVTSMGDIIRNAIGMEDLDDNLKKIAINKTQERKNEIINLPKTPVSNSCPAKFQANVRKTVNKFKEFVFPKALERHDKDNIAVQLALKDSILFIESLYTNRDDILNEKSDIFFRRR